MTNKPHLVLICALMCDERLFLAQSLELNKVCNVTVLVIKDFNNINQAAKHILANLVPKEEKFYLAGISMGGYIAMEVASLAAERITKLCLMATRWDEESESEKAARKAAMLYVKDSNNATATKSLLKSLLYNSNNEAAVKLLTDMNNSLGASSYINQQQLILSKTSFANKLANFQSEVLVIGGEHDKLTPPQKQKDIANGLPKANLVILKNCGHLLPLDQPLAITGLLEHMLTT